MCGRYSLTSPQLARFEQALETTLPAVKPLYNIAPGQANPVINAGADGNQLGHYRWGFVPHWSKEPRTP